MRRRNNIFERRHYEALAEIVAELDSDMMYSKAYIADLVTKSLGGTNPKYSPSRFREACKIDEDDEPVTCFKP